MVFLVYMKEIFEKMAEAGLQLGYSRSRRHPTQAVNIFTTKGPVDIFNLENTEESLVKAEGFMKALGEAKKTVLFVGTKPETARGIKEAGQSISMPYVAERWIGGTLTNWNEIKKRVETMKELRDERDGGKLDKYTKKERLDIARKIIKLERFFGSIEDLGKKPDAIVIVDPKKEHIALAEAGRMNIPVIALANSDCDISSIEFPIPGNDASLQAIKYVLERLTKAYQAN